MPARFFVEARDAIDARDPAAFAAALHQKPDIDALADDEGLALLHYVAQAWDDAAVIERLLAAGANSDQPTGEEVGRVGQAH